MSSQVGKYELGRALGAGGMAEVFVASTRGAEGFTRPVAIKRVLAEHSRHPAFAEMFVNEARLAAMLRHENVVQTLDFDRDDEGRLYLVMELVEGRDLDQLARSGPLPWPVVVHVLASVLRGLGHAHDLIVEGRPLIVVHRDVSPHNVLVSWDGTVKVSDFGIAKAVAATGATRSGAIKGKPAYMSPEQMMGADLDGRSDLFAVGVMMWELLTGRPLFAGGSLEETFARVLHQPITPAAELVAGLPPELDAITMTLLARDRDQRFQHARDVVAALESSSVATLRGRELLADLLAERFPDKAPARIGERPSGGVRTPRDGVRASSARAASGGAAGGVALAATMASAAGARPATIGTLGAAAVGTTAGPQGGKRGVWLALGAAAAVGVVAIAIVVVSGGSSTARPSPEVVAPTSAPVDAAVAIDAAAAVVDAQPIDAQAIDAQAIDAGKRGRSGGGTTGSGSPSGIQEIPLGE